MYGCPNCGGALKFDIASQQIKCDHCDSLFSPDSIEEKVDSTETEYYDTTAFTCPQCGGEIFSVEQEAASFCSFCGAPAILTSRIEKELRPSYIIPFKKTKEDCKEAYAQRMKHAFFVPKEFKDKDYLNEFRGIYMPYWTYQVGQHKPVHIPGEKSHRSGDYIITDHYSCEFDLDANYAGFAYDASSTFNDSISESLAPYNAKELVHFTPSYLLGFYADTADVDSSVYMENVLTLADDATYSKVSSSQTFSGLTLSPMESRRTLFGTNCHAVDRTLYPVWFLSYQTGNRVAYATVNGQTGKVVTDMPMDRKKYTLVSLLLTIPLFILLNTFFTITSRSILPIVGILTMITTILYALEIGSIYFKEMDDFDKTEKIKTKKKGIFTTNNSSKLLLAVVIVMCIPAISFLKEYLWPFVVPVTWGFAIYGIVKNSKIKDTTGPFGFICAMISILISAAIAFIKPVEDWYYYGASSISILIILYTIFDLIRNYNILSTQALPQYKKMGGDHRAY